MKLRKRKEDEERAKNLQKQKEPRVLIVEDEGSLANMYKMKLEKNGYKVFVELNGLDAVSKISDIQPKIVLLDIMMPQMDGVKTLEVIKTQCDWVDPRIIMFTNLDSKDYIKKCKQAWADDYLVKSNTTPKEVLDKIKEYIKLDETVDNNNENNNTDSKDLKNNKNKENKSNEDQTNS